jgi:hypothetical protein
VKWGVDFYTTFQTEFSTGIAETGANIITLGGYGGVKQGYQEGRVTATDFWSAGRAYAEGVYNTVTLGGGERAVSAYAEGKGAGGIALEAGKGVVETVLPINEIKTLADSEKNVWEKAEAFAIGTTKVAGVLTGGLAAKNAAARRLPGKPGVASESASGAQATVAPVEGVARPVTPAPSMPGRTTSAPTPAPITSGSARPLTVVDSHFRPNPTRVLQNMTNAQNQRLAQNPALARRVLRPREYAAGQKDVRVARMQYGNAVERLVAQEIRDAPLHRRMFERYGGPNNPDFGGNVVGAGWGEAFDITTPGAVAEHLTRPYGPGLNIVTYQRPPLFKLFP